MILHPALDVIFGIINPVRVGASGCQWSGNCPAHDDTRRSLTVGVGRDGRILFHCMAGCSPDAVRQAFGLTWSDLSSPDRQFRPRESDYVRDFRRADSRAKRDEKPPLSPAKLNDCLSRCESDRDCRRGVAHYAKRLGLQQQVLWDLGCRWKRIQIAPQSASDKGELWFPERDANGDTVGVGIRSWDGSKTFVEGSRRGVVFLPGVLQRPGPVYLVEGLTDTAALLSLDVCAIGRPSNTGGVLHLVKLLADVSPNREIIVVGENDRKPNDNWPGHDGAEKTARELAEHLKRPVSAALPPAPFKDAREWCAAPSANSDNIAKFYRQSLTIFAVFPPCPQEVTDDEIEAATIPIGKHSPYQYPEELCLRPGHMLLKEKTTHKLRATLHRCGSSSCAPCFARKKRLRCESLLRHFDVEQAKGGNLYQAKRNFETAKDWHSLRRAITRKGGNAIRFPQADGLFVVMASVEFGGAAWLPFDEAKAFTKAAIDGAVSAGRGKPFFHCTSRWAMSREKKESQYERVGTILMPPQAVKRLCQKMKIDFAQKRAPDGDLLLDCYLDHAAPTPETDPLVQLLLAKPDVSVSIIFPMHDWDIAAQKSGMPPWWDDYFAWFMNPTA